MEDPNALALPLVVALKLSSQENENPIWKAENLGSENSI